MHSPFIFLFFQVHIKYPSGHPATLPCPTSPAAAIVENIAREKWSTATRLIMKHEQLLIQIKESMLTLLDDECKALCRNQDFILHRCSPDNLKSFSIAKMKSDLKRLAPFLFSLLSTVSNDSPLQNCAAASILLRGRHVRRPNAFAYYINSVLQYGGAKKAVFQRLCKFGISTDHNTAVRKQRLLAGTCDDALQQLKAARELLLNKQQDSDGDVLTGMETLDLSGKKD